MCEGGSLSQKDEENVKKKLLKLRSNGMPLVSKKKKKVHKTQIKAT